MDLPFMKKKDAEEEAKNESLSQRPLSSFPHLMEIKPKERYIFCSDYFRVDTYYGVILAYFHTYGSNDNFGPFWGINRIPSGLGDNVTTINFEQVQRMGEDWVRSHQTTAEGVAQMNENSQFTAGTNTTKAKARRTSEDLSIIADELNGGASYLNVQNRMLVKAPTLEALDDAVQKIERLYTDRFATMWAAPYTGEQRQELSNLFAKNAKKRGKGFYFTSAEFAGSYSLVTHGMEDPGGEYVGYMVGDVNNSAVLFDVDNFRHHVVVASEQFNEVRGRAHVADMWGSKMSQAALLDNARVVHIILDGADLDRLGPKFTNLTYRIDMNHGDVNMFEMFGEEKDELSIFSAQMEKLTLMAEQAYETTDSDRSIIRGSLQDVATKFYIDNRMWYENAIKNRERLRVVNIPHREVPKLEMFVSYLDTEYKALANRTARDDERLHAMNVLLTTFRNLLSNNGDLFNTTTSDVIDGAKDGRRVVYDFSRLAMRGQGVAMAQLVNVIGYAVQNLKLGDLVILHGAEHIEKSVRPYILRQFDRLYDRGGRVAFLYNDLEKMLNDQAFNLFDKADYTIFGNMSENIVKRYQEQLGQMIPKDLVSLVTDKSEARAYIRRGFDNVVFHQDLQLDPPSLASTPKAKTRAPASRVRSAARKVKAAATSAAASVSDNGKKMIRKRKEVAR